MRDGDGREVQEARSGGLRPPASLPASDSSPRLSIRDRHSNPAPRRARLGSLGSYAAILADGRRLHLQHGPIDLVIEAFGEAAMVQDAYRAAAERFDGLLEALCTELPLLRAQQRADSAEAKG